MSEDKGTKDLDTRFEELTKTVTGLAETVTKLADSQEKSSTENQNLVAGLSVLNEKLDGLKPEDDDDSKKKKKSVDSRSLETMSRGEFLEVIFDKFEDMLDGKVKPLSDQITDVDDKTSKKELATQIKSAVKAHPDFWEWKDEMGAIANANPTLSVEDVYTLARTKDPERATELDEKFEKEKGDKDKDEGEEREFNPDAPFALTPTSGVKVEGSENMTSDQAAEAAWDKVVGTGKKTA
jgi:hypothetical protein